MRKGGGRMDRQRRIERETGSFTRRTNQTNSSSLLLLLLLAFCLPLDCLPASLLRTIIIVLIWHNARNITCNVRTAVIQLSTPCIHYHHRESTSRVLARETFKLDFSLIPEPSFGDISSEQGPHLVITRWLAIMY